MRRRARRGGTGGSYSPSRAEMCAAWVTSCFLFSSCGWAAARRRWRGGKGMRRRASQGGARGSYSPSRAEMCAAWTTSCFLFSSVGSPRGQNLGGVALSITCDQVNFFPINCAQKRGGEHVRIPTNLVPSGIL
jgi:hypothetical protein